MHQTRPPHPKTAEAALRAELKRLWELDNKPSPERLALRTGKYSAEVFTTFLSGTGPLTHPQIEAMARAVAPRDARAEFIRRWREIDQARQTERHRQRTGHPTGTANTALTPVGMALSAITPAGFAVALAWLRTATGLTYDQIDDRTGDEVSRSRVHRFIQNGECADEEFVDAVLRVLVPSDTERAPWMFSWRRVTSSTQPTATPTAARADTNRMTVHLTHETAQTVERVAVCALATVLAGVSLSSTILARNRIDGYARWLTTTTGLTANLTLLIITAVRAYLRLRAAPEDTPEDTAA
ncbi:hypothetical protein [Amycolatopsis sp. CA-230715]|uniref:hypothetical protein n=1 Tax=Amycolatopsis sp. CA-230715 TaxID=2745196 RepID=UPI001C02E683|nr:hypothetical protein [Amycolatopsis sp. CA-230715]QWF81095.1 hypothetical protein HUW46_04521 [Amycolatopsis sp. CA-230715]